MATTFQIWLAVAATVVFIAVARFLKSSLRQCRGRHHMIEFGHENDGIWVPGDIPMTHIDDDDCDEI